MALEAEATRLLDHGEMSRSEVFAFSQMIFRELGTDVSFGAFVHVRCGTRKITQTHPETTRVLTHYLAQEFPGDVFLSLNLARDKAMQPHRDSGNSNFPSLLCNLADGAPGGTWIEDPSGTVPRQCADGKVRDGKIVRGFRYRFSANKLWHAPELDAACRTVLVGWVPAGWSHVPTPDMCVLEQLGFQKPAADREGACALSLWSGSAVVQTRMERYMACSSDQGWTRCEAWVKGQLRCSPRELHVCLSSDSESSDVEMLS